MIDLIQLLQGQLEKRAVGTLVLGKASAFRELFFEKDLVFLCDENYCGKIEVASLKELGVPSDRLTFSLLDSILRQADLTRSPFAKILHEKGIVDEATAQELARRQLREEVLQLVLDNRGSFNFQKGRVPERLLAPDHALARAPLQITDLKAELDRRVAERQEIAQHLPSDAEVFVLTADGMAYKQKHPEDIELQLVVGLIDGFRTLGSLVDSSILYEHHVRRLVRRYLEEEFLKKTQLVELKQIAFAELNQEDARRLLPALRRAVKQFVDPLAARERLALVLEKAGQIEDAVVQYNYIGDALYQMRKPSKAIKAYHRAMVLKPDTVLLHGKFTNIYLEAAKQEIDRGELEQAALLLQGALRISPNDEPIARMLVQIYIQQGNVRQLTTFCDHIGAQTKAGGNLAHARELFTLTLEKFADNAALKKKLVNVYQDLGDGESALAILKDLARTYVESEAYDQALDMLGKIERLGGLDKELAALQRDMKKEVGGTLRTKLHRPGLVAMASALIVILIAYQGWSYLLWIGIEKRAVALAATAADTGKAPAAETSGAGEGAGELQILPGAEEEHERSVAQRCALFLQRFPLSLCRASAESLNKRCMERAQQLAGERQNAKDQLIRDAKLFSVEGDRQRVLSKLQPLLALPESHPWRQEAQTYVVHLKSYQRSSQDFLSEAQRLVEAEKWEEAHGVYRRAVELFPDSHLVSDIRFPVVVDTVPVQSEILATATKAEGPKPAGKAPHVFHLKAGEPIEVQLRAPGCYPLETTLHDSDGAYNLYVLYRKESWSRPLERNLSTRPVVKDGIVVTADVSGNLQVADTTRQTVVWSSTRQEVNQLVGEPLAEAEGLYTVWNDRRVLLYAYGANPTSSDPAAAALLEGLASTAIAALPSGPLIVGTSRAMVEVLSRGELKSLHRLSLPWSATELVPVENDLFVASDGQGKMRLLKVSSGETVWNRDLVVSVAALCRSGQSTLVVQTNDHRVLFLNAANGTESSPALKLSPKERCVLDGKGGLMYVLHEDGSASSRTAENGQLLVRRRMHYLQPSSVHPLAGNVALVHREGRNVIVLDGRSLRPLWAATHLAEVTHVGGTATHLAVGTREGRVFTYHDMVAEPNASTPR